MERNPVSSHMNPPAYSPGHANPPSYSSLYGQNNQMGKPNYGSNYGQPQNNQFMQSSSYYGLGNQPLGQQQPFIPQQSPYMGNHGSMFGGAANSPMPAYGYGYGHYKQSATSPFSLSNMLAGAALWHVGSSMMGGGHRSSHVYHHYDKNPENQDQQSQSEVSPTLPPSAAATQTPQLAEYQNLGLQRYGENYYNAPTNENPQQTNFTETNKQNSTASPTMAPLWVS
jgi:hypothetical protein